MDQVMQDGKWTDADVARAQELQRLREENERLKAENIAERKIGDGCRSDASRLGEENAALKSHVERLTGALTDAAMSLETIDEQAGRDDLLKHMSQVRGYAHSRANAGRETLAARASAEKEQP